MNEVKEFFDNLDRADVTHVITVPKKKPTNANEMASAWEIFRSIGAENLNEETLEMVSLRLDIITRQAFQFGYMAGFKNGMEVK